MYIRLAPTHTRLDYIWLPYKVSNEKLACCNDNATVANANWKQQTSRASRNLDHVQSSWVLFISE